MYSKVNPTAGLAKKPVRVLGDTSSDEESNTNKASKQRLAEEKKVPQKPVVIPKPKVEEKKEIKAVPKEKPITEDKAKPMKPAQKEESPKAQVKILGDPSSDEEDHPQAVSKPAPKKPVRVLGDSSSEDEGVNKPPVQPKKEPIAQEKILGDDFPAKPKVEKVTPPPIKHQPVQKPAVLGDPSSDEEDRAASKPSIAVVKESKAQEKVIGGDSPVKKPSTETPSGETTKEEPKRAVIGDPSSDEEDSSPSNQKNKPKIKVLGDPPSDEESESTPAAEKQAEQEEDKDTVPDDVFEQRLRERNSK